MTIFWRCRNWLRTGLLAALLLACVQIPQAAAAGQPVDAIIKAVVAASQERAMRHGYDNVSVKVRPLDNRLKLPLCEQALTSTISAASAVLGAVSVGIGCSGAKPWTIYVRSHVVAQRAIPVLVRPLPRHALVSRDDLKLVDQPLDSNAQGMIEDPEQIVGMQLTRALNAGSIVRVNQLRKPKVIKRGQQVTLVSGSGGLEVRIQGKALTDAASGERVAVSNLSSGRKVEGIAHSDGTVSVQ